MNNRNVYVIIVTYNGMTWIDKCLSSLRNSTEANIPIIVDNCSTDGTIEFIKEKYKEAVIIQNSENKGFGQANNQGIEYSYRNGGTHFFLLNQDAYVEPDTIKLLADIQDKTEIAILSPIHLDGEGVLIDQQFFEYSVVNEHNREFVSDILLQRLNKVYCVDFVNAAAWMLSRRCVERIGGFDPVFFIYGEDSNYCQRVHFHNEKIAIVPSAKVRHDRKVHGNTKVYNKRAVLSLLLKTYANINEPYIKLSKSRIVFHFWMFKNSLVYLLKLRFREWSYIFNGYLAFIRLIPKVLNSRKLNKIENPNYLDLNGGA